MQNRRRLFTLAKQAGEGVLKRKSCDLILPVNESFVFLIRIDLQLLISYENDVLGIEDVVYMYCSSLISTYGNYKTVL